jgi:hypothetical protein
VQALNTGGRQKSTPAIDTMSANNAASPPPLPAADQPESIEEQISTSVTQSLKALNAKSMPGAGDDDDDDDDKKSGFFSRFKRS